MRVDIVSVPFAGHLFPLLDLARHVEGRGVAEVRVLCTEDARDGVERMQLAFLPLLRGEGHRVREIAESASRVGSNPVHLFGQLKQSLALLDAVRDELREIWRREPPKLVIADSVVPIAGVIAEQLGIPWWTTMASPCVLETSDGTPAYLGGWKAPASVFGEVRDACGRKLVRAFKQTVAFLTRNELRQLGFAGLYRSDGLEAIYSSERVVALGCEAFEFPRHWPEHVRFIGPVTGCPPFPCCDPQFVPGRRHILVTLGTHLWWAKERIAAVLVPLARSMGDCVFHFTRGREAGTRVEYDGNLHYYDFIPYDVYMDRYDAAVIHGGTGIIYSCLKAATPMLVWPHDYDQFDHAARIVAHGLGLRCRVSPAKMEADLRRLMTDGDIRSSLWRMRSVVEKCNPYRSCVEMLEAFKSRPRGAAEGQKS